MAIQMRRGNYADFDPTRMQAGEFAVCLDNGYVFITLSSGNVVRLGTADTIEEALHQAEEYVSKAKEQSDISTASATASTNSAKDSEAYAIGERGGVVVPDTDVTHNNNAKYYSEEAKKIKDTMDEALETQTPQFEIDWSTGELIYSSSVFSFYTDENGILHWATE